MKNKIKDLLETPQDRIEDAELYEIAMCEIEEDKVNKGLWAKATALSEGDENKIKSLYLQLRVEILKDENKILDKVKKKHDLDYKDGFEEDLDRAIKTVSRVAVVYYLLAIIAFLLGVLLLFSGGDGEYIGLIYLVGAAALYSPYWYAKKNAKKPVANLWESKRRVNMLYITSIIGSLFLYVFGWVVAIYLVYRIIDLNMKYKS